MLPLVFLNMCFAMEIARVFEAIAHAPASFFPGLLDDRGVIAVFARLCFESIVLNARFLELTYNSIYAAPRSASATPAVKAKASPPTKAPAAPKVTKAPPGHPQGSGGGHHSWCHHASLPQARHSLPRGLPHGHHYSRSPLRPQPLQIPSS